MASDILAVPHAGSPRQAQLKVVSRKVLVEKNYPTLADVKCVGEKSKLNIL